MHKICSTVVSKSCCI